MAFHKEYSDLINQLPPSLVRESWRRLTSRKRNPLSIEEVQSINPIVEAFLKHEIEVYNRKKQQKRCTPLISNHEVAVSDNEPNYNEDEFNCQLNKAIDEMRQEFVNATKEKLIIIKEQKDKEIEQIRKDTKLEMAKKDTDGKIYPDRTRDA